MLKIYLARHGQNQDNASGILNGHRDLPLTELGRKQAEDLAFGISASGLTFDATYASPLCRAYDTAVIVTDVLGLPRPQVLPLLIERNFGVMTGERISDIEMLCAPNIVKTAIITYFLTCKGAESFPELFERGSQAIAHIESLHQDGAVLLTCHGDIGKMIFAAYYGMSWMDALTSFHFGNSELLLLSPETRVEDAHVLRIKQHNH